ncbi:hypothetical protein RCJ22_17620, partial [Vibrio sp. FNV 38]|nr:hypothetical protein [Vibrio sp. FNV 38]
ELYSAWLQKNHYEDNADTVDLNDNKNPQLYTFKFELMSQFQQEMYDYMRGIGVKIPITGENVMTFFGVLKANRGMDFTDNHVYPNNIPCWNEQTHICMSQAPSQMDHFRMSYLSCMRSLKKPFFVSEWDMSWPNDYRAESSVLFAA